MADLLNAPSADETFFGQNMTSLTFHVSRALARTWQPGDEVLVTRLDHDANVRPWALAARDAGALVRWVDVRPDDCTLDEDSFHRLLGSRTKLVAFTAASNLSGSMPDVARLTRLAHDAGALVYLDAVHYAPHGLIDVQAWQCDFLVCSAYKFFGPHVGVAWGRRELLETLPAYKVRPASDIPPDRWMTGTQNHEGLAGVTAAVDYLASLAGSGGDRRQRLRTALTGIRTYERALCDRLLDGLARRPRFRVWGITAPDQRDRRTPTVALTCADRTPRQLAEHLAAHEIYAWSGNVYAVELCESLGLEVQKGVLRLGLVHYNAPEEVDRVLEVLHEA
jgi:cysteine desulfurase family protein (TIGR01976 family)